MALETLEKTEVIHYLYQDHFIVECDSNGEVPKGAFDNFK